MPVAARILTEPPISGTAPEYAFNTVGPGLWVEFRDSTHAKWYGVFGGDPRGAGKVIEIPEKQEAFVLSNGAGYWVDIDARKTVFAEDDGDIVDAIYCAELDRIIATTSMGICVYGRAGLEWESGTIAHVVEGIEWLRDTIVQVRVFDDEYPFGQFRFNAITRQITEPDLRGRYEE